MESCVGVCLSDNAFIVLTKKRICIIKEKIIPDIITTHSFLRQAALVAKTEVNTHITSYLLTL